MKRIWKKIKPIPDPLTVWGDELTLFDYSTMTPLPGHGTRYMYNLHCSSTKAVVSGYGESVDAAMDDLHKTLRITVANECGLRLR